MSNPRVRAARRLKRRSGRVDELLVEGRRAVLDALAAGARIAEVFIAEDAGDVRAEAAGRGAEIVEVSGEVLAAIADTATPQGVVAVAAAPAADLDALAPTAGLVVVLAGIGDPGNAGTLIRSAAAAGASGVVFVRASVDPWHPKVVRASAAALFSVPVVRDAPLEDALETLASHGLVLVGADAAAATAYYDADLTRRLALVLGNEAWGLPGRLRARLEEVVGIPMPGRAESLNVGTAGSIMIFEALRQRRLSSGS